LGQRQQTTNEEEEEEEGAEIRADETTDWRRRGKEERTDQGMPDSRLNTGRDDPLNCYFNNK